MMLTVWELRWKQQKQAFIFRVTSGEQLGEFFYVYFYTLSSVSSSVKLKVIKHVSSAPGILCKNEWKFIALFCYFGRWPLIFGWF